jgi:hypothetical protein
MLMVSDFGLTVNSALTTHCLHQRDRVPRAIGKFRKQSIHTYSSSVTYHASNSKYRIAILV